MSIQQQKGTMILISRQCMPVMAALALFVLPIPNSKSSTILGSRLAAVPYPQTSSQGRVTTTGLDSKNTLLAGLDCRHPGTQAEINNCAVFFAKESDRALNQTYQRLRSTLSATQEKLLVTAQLSWIKFRDDQCALERSFLDGGSLSTTSQLACIQRLSDGREKELKSLLNVRNFQGKVAPGQTTSSVVPSTHPQAATLIGPDRIGPAVIGKTLGDLRRNLGSNDVLQAQQRLMVDIVAVPLAKGGVVQLYVLFPESSTITDASVIHSLLTKNPNFKTREGVGPGMSLAEAERIYGQATLSYNTSNESREVATFSRQPSQQMRFGVKRVGLGLAGNYEKTKREYHTTQRYDGSTSIAFVQVNAP